MELKDEGIFKLFYRFWWQTDELTEQIDKETLVNAESLPWLKKEMIVKIGLHLRQLFLPLVIVTKLQKDSQL